MTEQQQKQAQAQAEDELGRIMLGGVLQALQDTGHAKAASYPDLVVQAVEGMNAIQQEKAAEVQPIIEQSDRDGLEALAQYAPQSE